MTLAYLVAIIVTIGAAAGDARQYGVRPFRRLAPDSELGAPTEQEIVQRRP